MTAAAPRAGHLLTLYVPFAYACSGRCNELAHLRTASGRHRPSASYVSLPACLPRPPPRRLAVLSNHIYQSGLCHIWRVSVSWRSWVSGRCILWGGAGSFAKDFPHTLHLCTRAACELSITTTCAYVTCVDCTLLSCMEHALHCQGSVAGCAEAFVRVARVYIPS